MSDSYAKQKDHEALSRRVDAGFKKTDANINELSRSVSKNITTLSNTISDFFNQAEKGDSQNEKLIFREFEKRAKEKRSENLRLASVVVTLLLALFAALWWGINNNADLKIANQSKETCEEIHRLEIMIINHK